MKLIILALSLGFTLHAFAKPISNDLTVVKMNYNEEKKYYEVQFRTEAGIYKSEDKFFKCLQKSMEKKKSAKVSYEPMGLLITDCSI